MANTDFTVPVLVQAGAWHDLRGRHKGGFTFWWDRPLSDVKRIVIHHTDTWQKSNMLEEVDYVSYLHTKVRGWGGIGYHIIITSEEVNGFAKVAYVGDLATRRAHALNSKGAHGIPVNKGNEFTIGVNLVGRFQLQDPTPAQLRSLYEVCKELVFREDGRLPNLKNDYNLSIAWHRDMDSTACPVQVDKLWNAILNDWRPQQPPQVDDLYRVILSNQQVGAFKERDNAFNRWLQSRDAKVTFQNADITSQFIQMANDLQQQLNERDAKIGELAAQVETLQTLANDLTEVATRHDAQVTELSSKLQGALSVNQQLSTVNQDLQSKIDALQLEIDGYKSDAQTHSLAAKIIKALLSIFKRS